MIFFWLKRLRKIKKIKEFEVIVVLCKLLEWVVSIVGLFLKKKKKKKKKIIVGLFRNFIIILLWLDVTYQRK